MEQNFDVSNDILEEIALEGLDGITISSLFLRLKKRARFLYNIDEYTKKIIWDLVTHLECVDFYTISKDREDILISNDHDNSAQLVHESNLYKISPVKVEGIEEHGSCMDYTSRENVSSAARTMSLTNIQNTWGCRLVIVADKTTRLRVLCGDVCSPDHSKYTCAHPLDYIYLELIGRSRERGLPSTGPGSAQNVTKDPRTNFYHIQHLVEAGIVRKIASTNCTKLFLTRYDPGESDPRSLITKALLKRPNFTMARSDVITDILGGDKYRLKKIMTTGGPESKLFKTVSLPYPEVYPEKPLPMQSSNSKRQKRVRKVTCITLINPKATEPCKKEDADNADNPDAFQDISLKTCMKKQVYMTILGAGSKGITRRELSDKFICADKAIIIALKKLASAKVIAESRRQMGRQVVTIFTLSASEMKKPAVISRLELISREEARKEASKAPSEDVTKSDAFSNVLKEVKEVLPHESVEQECPRKLWRIGLILRAIKSRRIVSRNEILKYIVEEERKVGYKESIDRRSIARIGDQLIGDGIIKQIDYDSNSFYVEPNFPTDSLLSNKMALTELKPTTWNMDTGAESDIHQLIIESQAEMATYLAEDKAANVELVTMKGKHYLSPKFMRLSVLHDLLFYLTRGYTGDTTTDKKELMKRLSLSSVVPEDLKDQLPPLFKDRISCYMFLPPLPNADRTPGWCSLATILINAPLMVYMKLVRIQEASPALTTYLGHPLKCHFPLRLMPPEVRAGLLTYTNMVKILYDVRRLCFMGLVQFGARGAVRNRYMHTVYVNRNASLLDTTTSGPGHYKIEDGKTYNPISYHFQSTNDIKAYWVNLFNVCLETKLGVDRLKTVMRESVREFSKDGLMKYLLDPSSHAQALERDKGSIPGDLLGAGGIDSAMFSFLRQNWISGKTAVRGPDRPRKIIKKKMFVKKKEIKPKKVRDEREQHVYERMQRMRVNWSSNEDNILVMCKVAADLLTNTSPKKLNYINRADFRVAVRRKCKVEAADKTQFAVARRISFLKKGRRWSGVMNTLRRAPELQRFLEDRPLEAPAKHPPPPDYLANLRALFHEMVDFMTERFLQNGLVIHEQEFLIPDSIEEFNNLYVVKPKESPITLRNIQEDSIRAVLLSSLASAADKTSQTSQLFEVYRQYDEALLKNSLTRLHKQRIVTMRKSQAKEARCDTSGVYKFSQRFKYLMNTRFQQSVYYNAYLELNRLLRNSTKEFVDVDLSSGGAVMCALASSSHIRLNIHIPEQFIQIDPKAIPPKIYNKIMTRYKELQQNHNLTFSEKPLVDEEDDEDDQPPAKRALYDTDFLNEEVETFADVKVEHFSNKDEILEETQLTDESLAETSDSGKASIALASVRVALLLLREIAKEVTENHSRSTPFLRRPIDIFAVSSSKVKCITLPQLVKDYGADNTKIIRQKLCEITETHNINHKRTYDDEIMMRHVMESCKDNESLVLRKVVDLLEAKKTVGASLSEIRDLGEEAAEAVKMLEGLGLVVRLGITHTRIVSRQFAADWAIRSFKITRLAREKMTPSSISMAEMVNTNSLVRNLNDLKTMHDHAQPSTSSEGDGVTPVQIIMRPWLRVDGSVNRRVLDRMLGSVLGIIMTYPGCSIAQVAERFSPALTPVWIRELVSLLENLGCVSLLQAITQKTSLFEEGSVTCKETLNGLEANDEILVNPRLDAIVTLGQFIGNKAYSKDILELS